MKNFQAKAEKEIEEDLYNLYLKALFEELINVVWTNQREENGENRKERGKFLFF
jgi:hypothetical protein